jgi:hypothetical protein
VAEWEVEFTDEFETWWDGLIAEEQESVAFYVGLLEARGVTLDHPYSSKVAQSRHRRMRELRIRQTTVGGGTTSHGKEVFGIASKDVAGGAGTR